VSTLRPFALCLSFALLSCSDPTSASAETPTPGGATVAETPAPGAQQEHQQDPPIPADTEIVTTASGLKYSVLAKGSGERKAHVGDRVSMQYTGWLPDGTMFDSSRNSGQPFSFNVGSGVIEGWTEAAQLMSVGDRLKLTIPPDLAYGDSGSPPVIPPGATLIFEVEMVDAVFMPEFHEGHPEAQVTEESGLIYEPLAKGDGPQPVAGDVLDLKFAVWTEKGDLIACDQTLGSNLKGACGDMRMEVLNVAPKLMTVGARYRFIVPAELGFGDQPPPGVAPGEPTIWELELVAISKPLPVPEFAMPADTELTTTDSGLQYQVVSAGSGEQVKLGQQVTVHYAGWLTDGTLFDASYKRGEPAEFQLSSGGLIRGWIEGLPLMKVGATYLFVIPPELGYGEAGSPPVIPANATLVFRVEVISAA